MASYLLLRQPGRPEVSDPVAEGGRDFVLGDAVEGRHAIVDAIDLLQEVLVDLYKQNRKKISTCMLAVFPQFCRKPSSLNFLFLFVPT